VLLLLLLLQFKLFQEKVKKADEPKPLGLVVSRHGGKEKGRQHHSARPKTENIL